MQKCLESAGIRGICKDEAPGPASIRILADVEGERERKRGRERKWKRDEMKPQDTTRGGMLVLRVCKNSQGRELACSHLGGSAL